MSMSNANHNNWLCCCLLPFDIIADMDAAEEERADFNKLRQKINSHRVIIDSCTPGLYDLLVCPKIMTRDYTRLTLRGGHGSLLKFFYGLHWILSSLGVASRPKFSSQDAVQRLTIYAEKSVISCWPKLVVANTKKSDPCGDLHGKINCNWPSTRESLRLEVLDLGEKASRIILATDGDIQGQALAEELSRRLGRESLQYSTRFIPIPLNLYSVKKKRSTFYRRTSPLMQTVLMFPGAGK
ncbi:uncharacterized protein LOC142523452 isoform X3 [Primulina tabacum]|uniref:uncharacterized protein LOC142523452 isoform X3 n=1 Tax=Primulina tabacum TaxID=48773 RepID=UPI003F59BB3D